jgi:hypothetical protein
MSNDGNKRINKYKLTILIMLEDYITNKNARKFIKKSNESAIRGIVNFIQVGTGIVIGYFIRFYIYG